MELRLGSPLYYVLVGMACVAALVIKNRIEDRRQAAGQWRPERNMLFGPILMFLLLAAVLAPRVARWLAERAD